MKRKKMILWIAIFILVVAAVSTVILQKRYNKEVTGKTSESVEEVEETVTPEDLSSSKNTCNEKSTMFVVNFKMGATPNSIFVNSLPPEWGNSQGIKWNRQQFFQEEPDATAKTYVVLSMAANETQREWITDQLSGENYPEIAGVTFVSDAKTLESVSPECFKSNK